MEFNVGDIRNWGDKATYGYPRKELKEGTYKFIGFDPTKSVFSTKKVAGYIICTLNANLKPHGKFYQYSRNNKLLKEANYVNGILNGRYITFDANTGVLRSNLNYKDGKGTGTLYRGNKKYQLVDGLKEGDYYVFHSNGHLKERGFFKNDTLNGNYTEYFFDTWEDSKQVKSEYEKSKNKSVGSLKEYYKNGKLRTNSWPTDQNNFESTLIENNTGKSRVYERFYRDGTLRQIEIYKEGKLISDKKWHANGQLEYDKEFTPIEVNYTINTLDGKDKISYETYYPKNTTKEFHPNGQLRKMTEIQNGIQKGWIRSYFNDGSLKEEYEANFDIKNGKYRKYSSDGILIEESDYDKGLLMSNMLFDSIKNIKVPYYQFRRSPNGDYIAKGIQRKIDSTAFEEKYDASTKELFHNSFNKKGQLIKQFQKRDGKLIGEYFSFLRFDYALAKSKKKEELLPNERFEAKKVLYSDEGVVLKQEMYLIDDFSLLARENKKGFVSQILSERYYDERGFLIKTVTYKQGRKEFETQIKNGKVYGITNYYPDSPLWYVVVEYADDHIKKVYKKSLPHLGDVILDIKYDNLGNDLFDEMGYKMKNEVLIIVLKEGDGNKTKEINMGLLNE